MVEKAVTGHVANQHRLVAVLTEDERNQLGALVAKFLGAYE